MEFEITTHLEAAVLPLAIALYVIGVFLKATPKVPDWLIPWMLLLLGVIGAILLLGLSVSSVIQGVIACGVAVLGNQLYKQAMNGLQETKKRSSKK